MIEIWICLCSAFYSPVFSVLSDWCECNQIIFNFHQTNYKIVKKIILHSLHLFWATCLPVTLVHLWFMRIRNISIIIWMLICIPDCWGIPQRSGCVLGKGNHLKRGSKTFQVVQRRILFCVVRIAYCATFISGQGSRARKWESLFGVPSWDRLLGTEPYANISGHMTLPLSH